MTHLCHLVAQHMCLDITIHTLQHAPIDCDPTLWYSRLDTYDTFTSVRVIPSLCTDLGVHAPLPKGFSISTAHRDACPFCSRPFTFLGFYALGCGHIYHFPCLVQMMMIRSTCISCISDIDISLYSCLGLVRYRPVDPASSSHSPPSL